MSASRTARIRAVLARRQPDLTLLMENVHKPHNLAAIARSADAAGLSQVHAVAGGEKVRLSQKSASGASKWVEVVLHDSVDAAFDALAGRGMQTLAMTIDASAVDYREIDYTRPTAVVVGSELEGLSGEAAGRCEHSVYIPMFGMVDSLNVSVATALVLFTAREQRERAGLYDTPRLDEKTLERRVFEWCQPVVSEYCRRHGLAYPAIDDDGDIVGPLPGTG